MITPDTVADHIVMLHGLMPECNRTIAALRWAAYFKHIGREEEIQPFLGRCRLTEEPPENPVDYTKLAHYLAKWDKVDKYRKEPDGEFLPMTDDMDLIRNTMLRDLRAALAGNFEELKVVPNEASTSGEEPSVHQG